MGSSESWNSGDKIQKILGTDQEVFEYFAKEFWLIQQVRGSQKKDFEREMHIIKTAH